MRVQIRKNLAKTKTMATEKNRFLQFMGNNSSSKSGAGDGNSNK